MNKKKLIGVPLYNLGDNFVGVTKPYMEYFKQFGTVVILSPDTFIENLDLLVLPGGKDVHAGGNGNFSFWNSDNERFLEHFDKFTLPKYIENGNNILGICRGMQAICRHFNVPLVQDITWNHGYSENENDTDEHTVNFTQNYQYIAKSTKVGSWHHQCAMAADVAESFDLDLVAYTATGAQGLNAVAEYIKHKSLPIWGIQSHPERNNNNVDTIIIKNLLNLK